MKSKIKTKNTIYLSVYLLLILFIFNSCTESSNEKKTLFTLLKNNHTNIKFENNVKENLYFNFLNYSYIYNGGGVAVGDINNDGLEDIYFSSNQGSNKLYINLGNFKFKDISKTANVIDNEGWTTGVTMIDINNDGWLDIYVSKSGSLNNHKQRQNKLYINQKDNSFKESAASYGIDHYGFSIQAYFFDFDNDQDLDMYLVNHRPDFRNSVTIDLKRDKLIDDFSSDQLFRNDNNKFVNITKEAGIANKTWGLSASIGDFNNDGYLDVFVANDFFHPDFVYINNKNGTFTDDALNRFNHISNNSMGSDFADINNDLQPDLIVLDMLAEDHIRGKENMASMNTNNFNMMVNAGYHHQYMSNVLQLNNNNGTFSEISQLAGIAKTDWSWAPLIADFNNDGFKDVFITNGIQHDLSNQDFRTQMRNNIKNRIKVTLDQAIKMMPSDKLQNYMYKNNGDLTFKNASNQWGITEKINSNGAAYSDLDNDGDLDLIINNQSDFASIYKNNSVNNFISFSLQGSPKNKNAIGAKIVVYTPNNQQQKEVFVSRGYQSSVTNKIHFGLGQQTKVDSVIINWGNGFKETLSSIIINKNKELSFKNAQKKELLKKEINPLFTEVNASTIGINYTHNENVFNDYSLQLLLPQKQSEITSALAVADVNNDGLDDFFVGNAKGEKASLFIQKSNGTFIKKSQKVFEFDKQYEDTDAEFIDVDNDNDLDLYVASGGYEVKENSIYLQDRLYINDGKGNFKKSSNLPKMLTNTKGIAIADYDNDGDIDIFVGSRVIPGKYPLAKKPYLLENKNGKFVDVTSEKIGSLLDIQMINDAIFSDYDNDGDQDLLIVGEWMPVVLLENINNKFIRKNIPSLLNSNGWYQTIVEADTNKDGLKDYIIGNWGSNNKFHPSKEKPLHVYADYLDDNATFDVVLSKVSKTGKLLPVRGKECSSQQVPILNEKVKSFKEFASLTLPDIYGEEALKKASHFEAKTFKTFILKNKNNGEFEIQKLPIQAQFSPTLSIETVDLNNDGYLDIFGVGNIYDAEVETIRYDASKGYVLFGNKEANFNYSKDNSYFNNNEAKAIKKIIINNKLHFIILNKNTSLKILKLNN